jgi:adenine-specific DNA-methyltransferase
LNLQFANIVINYDLPWNPQRIEQRIGRCHRYGQKLDVLVINFINIKNYAEQRVYELLSEKIKLFGNLFDFTDQVLGTEQLTDDGYEVREIALGGLGAGLDFERKILDIYRNCRTEVQIENSFKQLQLELFDIVQEKIEDAQRKVIQHFDEEVRQKLRVRQQALKESLTRFDTQLKRYLFLAFTPHIHAKSDNIFEYKDASYYLGLLDENDKDKGYRPVDIKKEQFIKNQLDIDKKKRGGSWNIKLRYGQNQGRHAFEDLIGKECQLVVDILLCARRTVNNTEEQFEKIITTGLVKNGDRWEPIKLNLDKIFDLDIEQEKIADGRLRDELEDVANRQIKNFQDEINAENEKYIYEEMDRLNQFVEESLLKFQQEMTIRQQEIKDLQKTMRASRTLGSHERDQIQTGIDKKQKDLFRAQKRYIQAQEEQFADKDRKVTALRNKFQMTFSHERIASVMLTITA